jgi:hydrophobe/amphiphile efflux-3 (HAE3) family protein
MKRSPLNFIKNHSKLTLVLISLLTIFFLYQAIGLELNGDYGTLLPYGEEPKEYDGGSTSQIAFQPQEVASEQNQPLILDTQVLTLSNENHLYSANADTTVLQIPEEDQDYPYTNTYLVMVEAKNLYTAEKLTLIDQYMAELSATRELGEPSSVFSFITLEKKGTRLMTVPFSPNTSKEPWTQEEADLLRKRIENDPIIKNYLVSEDMTCILFTFKSSALTEQREAELSQIMQPLRDAGISISINGGAVLSNLVMRYLNKDLKTLLVLCFFAILMVYYLSFKAKRSMLIPFSMSVIGIIWTFGTMKLLGYSLTIVNIVTPCMVLNLGSSYSIHVISEYYSDYPLGISPIDSTRKILRTIALACLTTIIGFLSLSISKTPSLREFGIAVGIGVGYCALLASTYLPAILNLVSPPKPKQLQVVSKGILSTIVKKLSTIIIRFWWVFLIIWIATIGGFFLSKDQIRVDTNYMSYFPKSDPFGQRSRHFAQKMGGATPFIITITAPENQKDFFLASENLTKVHQFEQTIIAQSNDILQCLSFSSYVSFANQVYSGKNEIPTSSGLMNLLSRMVLLMNKQGGVDMSSILNAEASEINIIIQNYDDTEKDLTTVASSARVEQVLKDNLKLLPDGTKVKIGGDPEVFLNFSNRLLNDQKKSTYFSYILVFLVLFIAFRKLSTAIYALIPILTGVMANYIFMYFLDIPFDLVTVTFSSVAIGAGVDDAIHFLIRYIDKKKNSPHLSVADMLSETIVETGRPIILTSLSIITGMLMLTFASYTPIRYFGSLMSIALMNCALATLFTLPSVIMLGQKIKALLRRNKPDGKILLGNDTQN